jgi:hypothetical protein
MEKMDGNIENFISNRDGHITTSLGTEFDDLFEMIDCSYVRRIIDSLKGFEFKTNNVRTQVARDVLNRQLSRVKHK